MKNFSIILVARNREALVVGFRLCHLLLVSFSLVACDGGEESDRKPLDKEQIIRAAIGDNVSGYPGHTYDVEEVVKRLQKNPDELSRLVGDDDKEYRNYDRFEAGQMLKQFTGISLPTDAEIIMAHKFDPLSDDPSYTIEFSCNEASLREVITKIEAAEADEEWDSFMRLTDDRGGARYPVGCLISARTVRRPTSVRPGQYSNENIRINV